MRRTIPVLRPGAGKKGLERPLRAVVVTIAWFLFGAGLLCVYFARLNIAAVFPGLPAQSLSDNPWLAVVAMWLLGGAGATYVVYLAVSWWSSVRERLRHHPFPGQYPPLQVPKPVKMSKRSARLLLAGLAEHGSTFTRITESVSTTTRSVSIETTFSLGQAGQKDGAVLTIPMLKVERGVLIDNFHVVDGGGRRLSTLTQSEVASRILTAFDQRMREEPVRQVFYRSAPAGRPSPREKLIQLLRMRVPRESLSPADATLHDGRVAELLRDIELTSSLSASDKVEMQAIVSSLAANYWICVETVSTGSTSRLTMTRSVVRDYLQRHWNDIFGASLPVLVSVSTVGPWRRALAFAVWVAGVLRELLRPRNVVLLARMLLRRGYAVVQHVLGARSPFLSHSLEMSARAGSYHLNLRGTEGTFAARQQFSDASGQPLELTAFAGLEYNLSLPRGQRQVHLYVRTTPNVQTPRFLQATFYERTPGSMAVASILTGVTLAIALILAIAQLDAFASACALDKYAATCSKLNEVPGIPNDTSGIAQILLAFPLAAGAAVIGLTRDTSGGGLFSRFAVIAAVTGALLALFISSLPERFSLSGVHQAWSLTLVALGAIFAASVASWLYRAAVHHHYLFVED